MSRKEKLVVRLLRRPKDFSYRDLTVLLAFFGYAEHTGGKTSGSRRVFIQNGSNHVIRLHKPHPSDNLKRYQIDEIINELRRRELI